MFSYPRVVFRGWKYSMFRKSISRSATTGIVVINSKLFYLIFLNSIFQTNRYCIKITFELKKKKQFFCQWFMVEIKRRKIKFAKYIMAYTAIIFFILSNNGLFEGNTFFFITLYKYFVLFVIFTWIFFFLINKRHNTALRQ